MGLLQSIETQTLLSGALIEMHTAECKSGNGDSFQIDPLYIDREHPIFFKVAQWRIQNWK